MVKDRHSVLLFMKRHNVSLERFIAGHREASRPVPKEQVFSILRQLVDALARLHDPAKVGADDASLPVAVHRGLEPAGILISEPDKHVAIADAGLCGGALSGGACSAYTAPETLLEGKAAPASDVWALGVIIYELATLQTPDFLGGRNPGDVFVDGWRPDLSSVEDSYVRAILRKIFVPSPEKRPTARELASLLQGPTASVDKQGPQDAALEAALNTANRRLLGLKELLDYKFPEIDTFEDKIAEFTRDFNREWLEMETANTTDMSDMTDTTDEPEEPEEESLVEEDDSTELMRAADRNDVAEARSLVPLQGGVQMTGRAFVGEFEMRKGTALMRAAAHGHAGIVQLLVEKESGMKDRGGWTALMWAAENGRADCVELLLGKEGGMRNKIGGTALMIAAGRGHADCAKLLLAEEGGRSDDDGETALMFAATHGHIECIKLLLGQEGGVQDCNGWTALMRVAERGYSECVRLLVEKEGGMKDNNKETALMRAAMRGHTECVKLLLEKEVGMQNKSGATALVLAVKTGRIKCVRLLMEEKSLKTNEEVTALDIAKIWGYRAIISLLAE